MTPILQHPSHPGARLNESESNDRNPGSMPRIRIENLHPIIYASIAEIYKNSKSDRDSFTPSRLNLSWSGNSFIALC